MYTVTMCSFGSNYVTGGDRYDRFRYALSSEVTTRVNAETRTAQQIKDFEKKHPQLANQIKSQEAKKKAAQAFLSRFPKK